MTRRAGWGIGLALVLFAAGCGGGRPSGPPEVHPKWESCAAATPPGWLEADDALKLPALDDDFTPVAAVVCLTEHRERPGGGTDLVGVEKRAVDLTALLAALRLPDERPGGGSCTGELPFVPWLALLDSAGRWVRPGVPSDACRKPRMQFREAYEALRTEVVGTRVLDNLESDEAVKSGCTQKWKDIAAVAGRDGGSGSGDPEAMLPATATVQVCVFAVPPDERGSETPAGDWVRGEKLPATTWTAIRREVVAAAPATGTCTTPATRFAVLHVPAGQIYVQADGCGLVLLDPTAGGGTLRLATPALAELLFPDR